LVRELLLIVWYVLNRVLKSKKKNSTYEVLTKRQLNLSYFLNLGLSDISSDFEPKRVKLTGRAYECVFIGYVIIRKAYRFYDLNAKVIIKSNGVDFYEISYPCKLKNSGGTSGGKLNSPSKLRTSGGTISDHILVIGNSYDILRDVIEPQRGKKSRIAKEYELGLYIGRRSIKP